MALGDTHGNRGFTKDAINVAASLGVNRLVQVGDFGWWPNVNNGQKFLGEIGKHAVHMRMPFYWMAGNHEDHDRLDEMVESEIASKGLDPDPSVAPFIHGKRITHIRSGARWEWDGVTFGALGGAYSIDRKFRTKHSYAYGWFPREMPDPALIPGIGKVDVLFTHEAPIVPAPLLATGNFRRIAESDESQRVVYKALMESKPTYLVHGHWHINYRSMVHGAEVWGLDCDLSVFNAACIYDTETRTMYSLSQYYYQWREAHDGQEPQAPVYRATR